MISLQQIAAASMLFHFVYYISSRGWALATTSFLPVFGININQKVKTAIIGFTLLSCALSLSYNNTESSIILFCCLTLYVSVVSIRLSNHVLLLYAISALSLCENSTITDNNTGYKQLVALLILLVVYLFSLIHKLNKDFLNVESSSALKMCDRFIYIFRENKVRTLVPIVIITSYVIIPIFLVSDSFFPIGIFIALAIHFLFGVSGNPHFSFFIALLYCQFFNLSQANLIILFMSVLISAISVRRFLSVENPWVFEHKYLGISLMLILNTLILYLFLLNWDQWPSYAFSEVSLSDSQVLVLSLVLIALVLNCSSPYLFGKTEFCLAMFSNLRLDQNNHLFLKSKTISALYANDYHEIKDISNLERARSSECRVIRHIAYLLDRRKTYIYSSYFLYEVRKKFDSSGLQSITLITANRFPDKVAKFIDKPYMIPSDHNSGIMG